MIQVHVSGGFTRTLRLNVIDDEAQDLSAVVFKIAMVPKGGAIPIKTSPSWLSPTGTPTYPQDGEAVLRLTLNESITPAGEYWAYVLPTTAQDAEPVKAADDLIVVS